MNNTMKYISIFTLFLWLNSQAWGQTTLQVLTKSIDKTVAFKVGQELEIIGEKAEVEVAPGSGSEIKIHAELSTKHPDGSLARKELDHWKFVVSTVGKKTFVRAYIGLKAGQSTPSSNFKAKIVVQVPRECPVTLHNKLGKARLENLRGPIALTGEFCQFQLSNLGGDIWLDSKYGSVEGKNLSGKIAIKTNRADVTLSELKADCSVQSTYGVITLETQSESGNIAVTGDKSEVRLTLRQDPLHNIHLKSSYGELNAPQEFSSFSPAENIRQANRNKGEQRPFVSIETTFGKISVQE
jgi:hypothetical protein